MEISINISQDSIYEDKKNCQFCNDPIENNIHIIFDCNFNQKHRDAFFIKTHLDLLEFNMRKILQTKSLYQEFTLTILNILDSRKSEEEEA